MENYIGEIRLFAGNFAPEGWQFCKGQLLPINEYDALYALLGTTYGGDGVQEFALPNMQSRVVVGQGQAPGFANGYPLGNVGGTESATLTAPNLPAHTHSAQPVLNALKAVATGSSPTQSFAATTDSACYGTAPGSATQLAPGSVSGTATPTGGGQAHSNIQPVLGINYIIATQGVWPSQP